MIFRDFTNCTCIIFLVQCWASEDFIHWCLNLEQPIVDFIQYFVLVIADMSVCSKCMCFTCSSSQSPVTIADGIDSSPTHYIFSYGTGSSIPVSTNSTQQCTSSSCQHTFRATTHHVQQYTVSVAARNVVGVGNASTPVTVGMDFK